MQMSVQVMVDNYFEQDEEQKEMVSTSMKLVLEADPVTYMVQCICRDVMNGVCDFIQYVP